MTTATITETKTGRGNVAALMTALLAACVAFQLNASMLSPALVTMGEELKADQALIGLSQTWFFTAAALFSLFLPRLSDIVGRKRVLVGMMVLMAVGSVIAALAPDITWLFVGRIIQGVSGPTVPLCLIMLRSAVSNPRKYGTLMGLITAVNGGVAGVDSFVGGYFAEHYGFRSIFWLMVVLAAAATALIMFLASESKPAAGTRMDWLGVFFIVVAVGALLTALNEAAKLVAGFNPSVLVLSLALVLVSAVAFFAFWRTEQRAAQPMVETVHLRQRATWAPLLTTTLTMTGIFAVINGIVPAFVQAASPGAGSSP
jgi:MFS family permease